MISYPYRTHHLTVRQPLLGDQLVNQHEADDSRGGSNEHYKREEIASTESELELYERNEENWVGRDMLCLEMIES